MKIVLAYLFISNESECKQQFYLLLNRKFTTSSLNLIYRNKCENNLL